MERIAKMNLHRGEEPGDVENLVARVDLDGDLPALEVFVETGSAPETRLPTLLEFIKHQAWLQEAFQSILAQLEYETPRLQYIPGSGGQNPNQ